MTDTNVFHILKDLFGSSEAIRGEASIFGEDRWPRGLDKMIDALRRSGLRRRSKLWAEDCRKLRT